MYDAKALAAWAVKYEADPARRAAALEQRYGPLVDDEIARKQLLIDGASCSMTLEVMDQVADAFGEMAVRRLTSLDFTDPFGAGLPTWNGPKQPAQLSPMNPRGVLTVLGLFEKWKEAHAKTRSASTAIGTALRSMSSLPSGARRMRAVQASPYRESRPRLLHDRSHHGLLGADWRKTGARRHWWVTKSSRIEEMPT